MSAASMTIGALLMWVAMRGIVRDTRQELTEWRAEVDRLLAYLEDNQAETQGLFADLQTASLENATLRARLSRAGQPRGERGKFAGVGS